MHRLLVSPSAKQRLLQVEQWLGEFSTRTPLLLLGEPHALARLVHRHLQNTNTNQPLDGASATPRACFAWRRERLSHWVGRLAQTELARRQEAPLTPLSLEAVISRVVSELSQARRLDSLQEISGRPGFPKALARTFRELSFGEVSPEALGAEHAPLRDLFIKIQAELKQLKLADESELYRQAISALQSGETQSGGARAVLLIDPRVHHALEARLLAELGRELPCYAVLPHGDFRSEQLLQSAWQTNSEYLELSGPARSLSQVQELLFSQERRAKRSLDSSLELFSAPGETRECVEIARRLKQAAAEGATFEQMAILLRQPKSYLGPLVEALKRVKIPYHLAHGLERPDPNGRALLALLNFRTNQFRVEDFTEYLSLGCAPLASAGSAPKPTQPDDFGLLPQGELALAASTAGAAQAEQNFPEGNVFDDPARPSLTTWEQLLVQAKIFGGADRWRKRLKGLETQLESLNHGLSAGQRYRLNQLRALNQFALPLVEQLASWPDEAPWGVWLELLAALAQRTLADPTRVLGLFRQLSPLETVGPIFLSEVRLQLQNQLYELPAAPLPMSAGKVFVGSPQDARGLNFKHVFVPGLAEKIFPQKLKEDPLLLDRARKRLGLDLATDERRVELEREALHLAVGAASEYLVVSYPRLDTDRGRPRVPSFYALELLRAAEGELPGFEALAKRAADQGQARMGWPAPSTPELAIDDAEYDLALLRSCLHTNDREASRGAAGYLVNANPHLGRSLRFRARRWNLSAWKNSDGLVELSHEAQAALSAQGLTERAYSIRALEQFTRCPYRFYLQGVLQLNPNGDNRALTQLNAPLRARLLQELKRALLAELFAAGRLSITEAELPELTQRVEELLEQHENKYRTDYSTQRSKLWQNGVEELKQDLRGWLKSLSREADWQLFKVYPNQAPKPQEDSSVAAPPQHTSPGEVRLKLAGGALLRPSVATLETKPAPEGLAEAQDEPSPRQLRAVSYRAEQPSRRTHFIIQGGRVLEPLLNALATEAEYPECNVTAGQLSFCTSRGGYTRQTVPLDRLSRGIAEQFLSTVAESFQAGFLPAAPAQGACVDCRYQVVCGPYEELRLKRKHKNLPELTRLSQLRGAP